MNKGNVTNSSNDVKASTLKKRAKWWVTKHHNMSWFLASIALTAIFVCDGYFNAWLGFALGGIIMAVLFVAVEASMAYFLGETLEMKESPFRSFLSLIGFLIGVWFSYTCLTTFNSYLDATKSVDYSHVDDMQDFKSDLFWQQILYFVTGNPDNAAKTGQRSTELGFKIIEQRRDAIETVGYNPVHAKYYRMVEQAVQRSAPKVYTNEDKKIMAEKLMSVERNRLSLAAIFMGVLLTLVLVSDRTTCMDKKELEEFKASNDSNPESDKPSEKPRVRLAGGADVFKRRTLGDKIKDSMSFKKRAKA